MLAAIRSAAVLGVDAFEVTVEVHVAAGLPQLTVVGLPVGAVKESRERVVAALANTGLPVPPRRITVNLAPADVRKEGTSFDLPIALGVLVALGAIPSEALRDAVVVGELALDGELRAVRGTLPIARWAADRSLRLVLPPGNLAAMARIPRVRLAAPRDLRTLVDALAAGRLDAVEPPARPLSAAPSDDLADVVGQPVARRALEIAAAGGHHLALVGPPGAGKTMLARRLPGILPPLDEDEAFEVESIRSVAGLPPAAGDHRPFRAPHHTTSSAGLVGGGTPLRPGEVSLAHHGVLFLDELLEFPRFVLDALRQPLEDGHVTIARVGASVRFPARFALVAAMNPCPCGFAGTTDRACVCAPADVARYAARLSGPLADRFDMHVTVAAVPPWALADAAPGPSSAEVRARVQSARERQRQRYAAVPDVRCNAAASGRWLDRHAALQPEARRLLVAAVERLALSARGFHRALRVARTIADLDGDASIAAPHVAEALRYRASAVRRGGGAAAPS